MRKEDILAKLPEDARNQIGIRETRDTWELEHPFIKDTKLYADILNAIEGMGGKRTGYFDKAMHYEIPKAKTGVTPDVVTRDKSKPPEIGVTLVKVESLVKSPYWTRQFKEDQKFLELVESIKNQGVSQNLLARWKNNRLELVYGHRRLLAAMKAGLTHVSVKIRSLSDEEVLLLQFSENEAREDLADMEKARFLKNMMDVFKYTQEELAKKIGKNKSWVSRHLAMLELEKVAPGQPIEVTERQAREILKAPEDKRQEILKSPEIPSAREIQQIVQPKLVECEFCNVGTSNPQTWHSHTLCSTCKIKADLNPEPFDRKFKRGRLPPEPKAKEIKPKAIEAWKDREARMHPQHSKMERTQLIKLSNAGKTPETDREYCVLSTTPDFVFPNVFIYLDHKETHKNRKDRDDRLRELLAKREGKRVVSIEYESNSQQEEDRVFKEIMEALH